jgi:hypothetical protein
MLLALAGLLTPAALAQPFKPDIPKAWDDKEVESFELPLAQRDRSPRHMGSEEYYKLKVRPIYRSYPMYVRGKEPVGYIESLKQKDPEIVFDPSKLRTKDDWIQAGKVVFQSAVVFSPAPAQAPTAATSPYPISSDGVIPVRRYYIRRKGVLETGGNACAVCHTRAMPDGTLFEGAQGFGGPPVSEAQLNAIREMTPEALQQRVASAWVQFGVPWIQSKEAFFASQTKEVLLREAAARHPRVMPRQGTSTTHAPHIPSLVGIQDLRYLDATGLVRHRSIGDLMRYAISNQGLDTLAYYGDFQPSPHRHSQSAEEGTRYSDEQLYAMALYIYSLKPPPNPNPFDDRAGRGQRIFRREGCAGCHTPPLYTSNKLTPAPGFKVPEDLLKTESILNVSVGTDPTLAMQTRRATGFYKIPSLRGVWYRDAFGHGGQAQTLEEWLDPARLKSDYVPGGYHVGPGPIQGHEFGLKLSSAEREDLIAFLKTL